MDPPSPRLGLRFERNPMGVAITASNHIRKRRMRRNNPRRRTTHHNLTSRYRRRHFRKASTPELLKSMPRPKLSHLAVTAGIQMRNSNALCIDEYLSMHIADSNRRDSSNKWTLRRMRALRRAKKTGNAAKRHRGNSLRWCDGFRRKIKTPHHIEQKRRRR